MAYLFVEMLVPLAKAAKIKVPKDLENYDTKKYPHWYVFSCAQLGQSLPDPGRGWLNAEVVAKIGPRKIFKVSMKDLAKLGFETGYPLP
jgi:hypothetical protein